MHNAIKLSSELISLRYILLLTLFCISQQLFALYLILHSSNVEFQTIIGLASGLISGTISGYLMFINPKRYPSNKLEYEKDRFIDSIYDWTDELFCGGDFDTVNVWIGDIKVENIDIDFMLAVLVSTLPAKSRLSNRAQFYNDVEKEIIRRGEMEDGLLTGLK